MTSRVHVASFFFGVDLIRGSGFILPQNMGYLILYNHALGRLEKAGNLEFHGETIIFLILEDTVLCFYGFLILSKLLGCFLLSLVNSIGFAVLCMYTAIWDDAKRPPYGCLLVALFFALKTLYLVLRLQIYIYIYVCVSVHTYFSYIGPQTTEPTHKLSKL